MGENVAMVSHLRAPLLFFDERIIYIARNRTLVVQNSDVKVVFIIAGTTRLEIDGRDFGQIQSGDALLIGKNSRQVFTPIRPAEERLHIIRITFTEELGEGFVPKKGRKVFHPERDLSAFLRPLFARTRVIPGAMDSVIFLALQSIRQEVEQERTGRRHRISSWCEVIATELVRQITKDPARNAVPAPGEGTKHWAVEHVKQFLLENHARDLTLAEIARDVNLSEEHLSRRFKETTGTTVFEFLRKLRVETAKGLLSSSKIPIHRIAERCGFSSAAQFSRVFHAIAGMAPISYREHSASRIQFQASAYGDKKG